MIAKNSALKLYNKYKTNDPFVLADLKNIIIIKEPLGTIKGFYNYFVRQKFIHINSDLPYEQQKFVCAHELGHALLHSKANTPFLKQSTYFSINKLEIQANKFAVELLLPDKLISNTLIENENITLEQIFKINHLPTELVHLKKCNNYLIKNAVNLSIS